MRKHTPLMKTLRQWQPLNRDLRDLAADGSLDLLTLSDAELAGIRAQAVDLVRCIDAWCETHRPIRTAATPNPSIQGA